ncbi:MAG: chromosome segregation protein SMC [Clostridia bacterium]|nr:chromosome segregation protein SMC [Clostridia bacterium]
MYLKRLDVYGFKSFMDKLSISFDYAITAIVGPNGSGKSNITDAIRWVLGEQSVKSLRGSRMEDVIFAGTALYKPVSFAEVSLVLDNTSGLFSSPYSEITVTRRVYRSGESEYFLNKTPCRLRDIHELFMDTGLGRDGYSIIGQGQIDSVLSQKSEDRRQIFEEAAGISKYKYKKNEAARKLATTEDNLARVKDIHGELAARLGPLAFQARKAREYLDLYEKLKTLEINLSILDIEKLQKTKEDTASLYHSVCEELEREAATLEQMQKAEEDLYGAMKSRDAEMESLRTLLHSTDLSIKGWEGDNALLSQRMETEKNAALSLAAEKETLWAEIEGLQNAVKDAEAYIEACKAKLADAEKAVETGKADLEKSAEDIRTQSEVSEALAASAAQLLAQADETAKHLASLSDYDLNARIREVSEEIALCEKRMAENEKDAANLKKEVETLSAEMKETEEKFRTLQEGRPKLQAALSEDKNNFNALLRDYNQRLSKKNALADMEQNMEGYGKGVRAVINANLPADIHGVLSQLITAKAPFVTAIETALGAALQNIVVGSEEDAKVAISFLKQHREGRATFLPISAIRGTRLQLEQKVSACPGFIGLGCDLVSCDGKYKDIILHLLGQTVVMDTIDNAIIAARKFSHSFKIVTKDGEVLMRGGSMAGGSRAQSNSLLGRSDVISSLEKECEALSAKMDKLEEEIDDKTDRLKDMADELESLRNTHMQKKSALLERQGNIQLKITERENEEKHLLRLQNDLESAHAQLENADKEHMRLKKLEADLRRRHGEALQKAEEARTLLHTYMENQSHRRDDLAALQVQVNSKEKDLEAAKLKKEQTLLSIRKLELETENRDARRMQALQNAEDLLLRQKNRLIDIEEAKKRAEEFKAALTKMGEEKTSADAAASKMRTDIQSQNEKLYALQGEKERLSARLEKAQDELEATVSHLWDAYELTYSAAVEFQTDIGPITAAKDEAAKLRRSIRALGSVNVDAVTEYAEVKERYEFLSKQIEDLEKAISELQKIIQDMTKVMTETFAARFHEIAEHFKDTFRALFGGGTGKLTLSDPDNILESGIEIDVQPPGKKLQSLSLLSGGEKALTAIAILFSVLKVRPAPFCILDEIESALDDHNIDRFASYLREYDDTQFIIVTHRRGTMEAADVLYGVTMQEKGVSKLLTMQLDDIRSEYKGDAV